MAAAWYNVTRNTFSDSTKGPLYQKPLDTDTVPRSLPRFSAVCIPIHQLSNMSRKFNVDAGIGTDNRNISNHSGRVTCCTRLNNTGFTKNKAFINSVQDAAGQSGQSYSVYS